MTGKPAARSSTASRAPLRCAIYTRKSSEEGLGQEFNSLDAQREACAAYVASQKHEGWKLAPERYDDGGLSGGTLDRPALQRLLADIDAGRVQMVVVYKIDRLTRSLADFAKLVERLEGAGCSFVSVTQAFNTSSSMGRLTLNVLLSFAQFEREVTAERIRDKIAASKRKGMWMGGTVPLGYNRHPDPQRRELVADEAEAEQVRALFRLYDERGCLREVELAAAEQGLRSKRQAFVKDTANATTRGGGPLSRGQIHYLLTNTTYRGLIRHKDAVHPGLHPAIVEQELWDRVQAKLQAAVARPRGQRGRLAAQAVTGEAAVDRMEAGAATSRASLSGSSSQTPDVGEPALSSRRHLPANQLHHAAPLTGKLRDETGDRLTPTHTTRHGRQHRYYVSGRLLTRSGRGDGGAEREASASGRRAADPSGWRLPARALEEVVARTVAGHLRVAAERHALLIEPDATTAGAMCGAALRLAEQVAHPPHDALRRLIASAVVGSAGLTLQLDPARLGAALGVGPDALHPALLIIHAPLRLRRRGVETKLVAGQVLVAPTPNPVLTRTLIRAYGWLAELRTGVPMATLAQREGCAESYLRTRLPLAFLSPRLQAALLAGTQAPDLSLERMVRTGIPLDWAEQEQRFGLTA